MNEDSHEYRARTHSKQLRVSRLILFYELSYLALSDRLSHHNVAQFGNRAVIYVEQRELATEEEGTSHELPHRNVLFVFGRGGCAVNSVELINTFIQS